MRRKLFNEFNFFISYHETEGSQKEIIVPFFGSLERGRFSRNGSSLYCSLIPMTLPSEK